MVDLHGEHAREGVGLRAFEEFAKHLRAALRENFKEVASKAGGESPGNKALAEASNLTLVHFKTGSGVATFAPGTASTDEPEPSLDGVDVDSVALTNFAQLVGAVEAGTMSVPVADALEKARNSMGEGGEFGVTLPNAPMGRVVVDKTRTSEVMEAQVAPPPVADQVLASGRLHLLEFEGKARRVEVRTSEGQNLKLHFDEGQQTAVAEAADKLVRVTGVARADGKSNEIDLVRIDVVEELAQTSLFNADPTPLEKLMRSQGVSQPQGLDALSDPSWSSSDEDRRFLELMMGWQGE